MTSALSFQQEDRGEQSNKKGTLSYSDFSHPDWFNSLPNHWKRIRLKYLAQEPLAYGANESASESNPDHPRFIRITDVNEDGSLRPETFKSLAPELAEPYLLEDGDILLARSGATIGKAFIYRSEWGEACFAGYLIRLRSDLQKVVPQFLYYYTQSNGYWLQVYEGAIQATIQNFSAEKYGNIFIPLPPKSEQQEIVFFLDRETAEIDALVAEKERMLLLLEEKRQALTSHVITRGLDPNAPLKSSGLDWLSNIPQHWQTLRAKGLFREIDDRTTTGEEELLSLRMHVGLVPHHDVSDKILEPKDVVGFKRVQTGQLVINRMRASMGLIAVAEQSGLVSPDYAVFDIFRPIHIPYFLALFNTALVGALFRSVSRGIGTGSQGFLRLYTENFLALHFPVPPLEEQKEIMNYLHEEQRHASELEEALTSSITLLKERRSALITAAVTGQIDVEDIAV